ncbi:MAG: hypothetical protein AVDCRST_MAG67-429 [uncultured Solirubrobacteraceae bacterium]|uniref:Uncharacterized protein n=1 Tax=uncultured Solirubrobacteraceae bacterium TaxID=1162706 RepID=A0A6J4RRQ8_9ACTN|nr:MAG: hypothetical protein AVDCRST_MAG67-429 [uncultured Solirubrobacteraceae bacterium]
MEFWFEFDNFFNSAFGEEDPEADAAIRAIGGPFAISRSWHEHRNNDTYPDGFKQDMTALQGPLMKLAEQQLAIFDRHFEGDAAAEQNAFEEFGQGLNFDDRRPVGDKVHKMDQGSPSQPPQAYHAWHAFMRAVVLLGADEERWLGLNRNLALAWGIQAEARPADDNPNNPPLPQARMEELRAAWLALDADGLDEMFDNDPLPPRL